MASHQQQSAGIAVKAGNRPENAFKCIFNGIGYMAARSVAGDAVGLIVNDDILILIDYRYRNIAFGALYVIVRSFSFI